MSKLTPCHRCGKTEADPVMGTVDAIAYCVSCERPVCSDCADHDYATDTGAQSLCKGGCGLTGREALASLAMIIKP